MNTHTHIHTSEKLEQKLSDFSLGYRIKLMFFLFLTPSMCLVREKILKGSRLVLL